MTKWTAQDIPDQTDRIVVVTGTGGLGFEDALALARAGARVILAGRDAAKGVPAIEALRAAVPNTSARFERLDLADLSSVSAFAARMKDQTDRIDGLINNAAVMVPPRRQETVDGFELQLGTNYLGHFALTAGLLPLLRQGRAPRVVTLSSVAARQAAIDLSDLNAERRYRPMAAYGQSKLACLMFALELQRRSEAAGWGVDSLAAHPGIARTNLLLNAPGRLSLERFVRLALPVLFQPADRGALPTLFAATSPRAVAGGYYGPDGPGEIRGYPAPAVVPKAACEAATAERLWAVSEQLTGVCFG